MAQLTALGAYVVLDPHDGGGYAGDKLNQGVVATADFVNFWNRLATLFKDNAQVVFGLMNEPNGMTAAEWYPAMQAAINEIRNVVEARNLVLAPGIAFTGAHSWVTSGNATEMLTITDPDNNLVIEAHQYFDSDSSWHQRDLRRPGGGDRAHRRVYAVAQDERQEGLPRRVRRRRQPELPRLHARPSWRIWRRTATCISAGPAWAMGPWWTDDYVNNLDDRRARMLNEVDVFVG